MCVANLVYQLYESFLQEMDSIHFDEVLFSILKGRGVDENHFDFHVSKEAVAECLERLYKDVIENDWGNEKCLWCDV